MVKNKKKLKLLERSKKQQEELLTDVNTKHRTSHRRCSIEKTVLKNFAKFTGKHSKTLHPLFKKDSNTGVFV